MALPKQVQAQADALEKFEQQVAEANKPADEPKPNETPPAEPAPPEEKQGQEPVKAETPKPAEDDSADKWRQRYLSLQGQYNSQVPALQQQVAQLTDSVTQLTQKLEVAQAKPAEPQVAEELVTKNDVDAFGEDLVDLARRIAKEEFGKRETKYIKQIEALENQLFEAKGKVGEVAQSQARSEGAVFFERLNTTLPGWDSVQATEECQAWLASRIPGTAATWDMALKEAAMKRDVQAVVEVFDVFFEKYPNLNPRARQQQTRSNKQELERQVAPGKSSAASSQPQGKRTYTALDYQNESMRQMRLMQAGQMDKAMALEAELNAALAEGRVTP